MAAPKRTMQLNFFDTACTGSHTSIGHWKDPKDNSRYKDRLEYYTWLAKIAEKGKITSIFFADVYSPHATYGGNSDASYKGGSQIARLDPVVLVSAMAAVTKSVGFGITGSTSYISPYALARTWSTMDHVTNGRLGWNIVTSYSNDAAKAFGKESVMAHDERYAAAEEYMDIVYRLWEQSWEDGAQVWQADPEMAYDPSKVHRIEYQGKYHQCSGTGALHPSPQRTPFLFQAGSSPAGLAFGSRNAEALFTGQPTPAHCRRFVDKVKAAAVANGRDPDHIKVIVGLTPILGKTLEEAQAKAKKAREMASWQGGLARFGGFTGVDLSKYPLDEPFDFAGTKVDNAIQSFIENFKSMNMDRQWTPREVGIAMAIGGIGPQPVGTPEMVADMLEEWFTEGGCDGFNLSYVSNPESWEDVVELLVPELQRRGLYWMDYPAPGGTFRENAYAKPGQCLLPPDHRGAKLRWNAPKEEINGTASEEKVAPAVTVEPVAQAVA